MSHPRRALLVGTLVAPLSWLGACASLTDMTRLFIGVDELAALIQRQFPRQQRIADVIDVQLTAPRLRLVPQRNRLATVLDVDATERVLGRSAQGSVGLEYGLRYAPADASVRLKDVQVLSLQLDGARGWSSAMQRVSQALVENLLDDVVVAKLSSQRAEVLRRLSLTQATMTVTDRGVEVRFAR